MTCTCEGPGQCQVHDVTPENTPGDRRPRVCHDCDAKPGALHDLGCDVERCVLCGGQSISCDCVYEVNGLDPATLEETHPDIYNRGATDEMYEKLDVEIEKAGGRMPWTGIWLGTEECIEYGFYSRWVHRMTGKPMVFPQQPGTWARCKMGDEGAGPDVNRLATECVWDRSKRRFVLPS